ncbi:hypothetical protein C8R45DRAFT_598021 [Mycena sanguinolenta]|nr:hypothetical protein C8R45DRAFT_598021 [Mycena sanguinolenta]
MVRYRTALLQPAGASRRDHYLRWFDRRRSSIRPSPIQYPGLASSDDSSSDTSMAIDSTTGSDSTSSSSSEAVPAPEYPTSIANSTSTMTSNETTVMRIWASAFQVFSSILGDPLVCALFQYILGPAAHFIGPASPSDFVPVVDCGEHYWQLRPVLAHQFQQMFITLAGIILCAATTTTRSSLVTEMA